MKEKGRKNVLDRGSACKDQETGPSMAHRKEEVGGMAGSQAVWEPVSLGDSHHLEGFPTVCWCSFCRCDSGCRERS